MEQFINKYLFWIVFLLEQIFHKGMLLILRRMNISLEWSTILSKDFLLSLLLVIVEFIIIAYTLLGCVEPSSNKDYKTVRIISYLLLGIVLLISLLGILAYFELIK